MNPLTARHRMRRFARRTAALAAVLCLFWPPQLRAAATAPNPGDQVLVIYVNDAAGSGDNIIFANNVKTALTTASGPFPVPANVTLLSVPYTDTAGIGAYVTAAALAGYCQVWDVRFLDNAFNYTSCNGTAANAADTIVAGDMALYTTFLAQGGHLVLFGDNCGYPNRNQGLVNFINSVLAGGTSGWPSNVDTGITYPFADFYPGTAPDAFNTSPNNLATIAPFAMTSTYPGLVTTAGMTSGVPLIEDSGSGYAFAWAWYSSQLSTGNGKLAAVYDTTWLSAVANDSAGWQQILQNLYTFMSTCYNFTITKAVSPASICLGDQAQYSLCYTNTGTRAIPAASLFDTIPSCLGVVNAAGAVQAGNYLQWSLGSIPIGASTCITVTVQANSLGCE